MQKLFSLKGRIQNYNWGGNEFIPNLLDLDLSNDKCAEYWLGAHVSAPSIITKKEGVESITDFLKINLERKLGRKTANRFGRLPFLLKVLDVDDMLSIQVHPTKKEAENGFKKENDLGIPQNASYRNYKDDNHKPEIMVALSEFWLLHGFLPKKKLFKVLRSISEFSYLIPVFEKTGYYGLYKTVMEQSDDKNKEILEPIFDRILPQYKTDELDKANPDYWVAKSVANTSNGNVYDKGIFSIYFFNLVKVDKGEAIFQDAGIPHAYLQGQNIELMANSDNVIRGGLTSKHIDVNELLKIVKFEETVPNILKGKLLKNGMERVYETPAPDFELSKINLAVSQVYKTISKSIEILFLIDGQVKISETNTVLNLKKGDSVLIIADSNYNIVAEQKTTLYKATTPIT